MSARALRCVVALSTVVFATPVATLGAQAPSEPTTAPPSVAPATSPVRAPTARRASVRAKRRAAPRRAPAARRPRPSKNFALEREPFVGLDSVSPSRSVGWPFQGSLEHGVRLQATPTLRPIRRGPGDGHFFGTAELVRLLEHATERVAAAHPGTPPLVVADLSAERGGRLRPHRSHRNGRDVDVVFYLLGANGEPIVPTRFHRIRRNGESREGRVRLDDTRTWAFVAALLEAEDIARVQAIFCSREIKARLLAEAARVGAARELIDAAEAVLGPPSRGSPHRDHFHIRIYCSADDGPECKDEAPYLPSLAERRERGRPDATDRAAITGD